MSTHTAIYDVFISYSVSDRSVASEIANALTNGGLDVFWDATLLPAESVQEAVWQALAESAVVIAVFGESRSLPSTLAIELGASMAWQKQIFLVHRDTRNLVLPPTFLAAYPIYPLSRIDDLAQAVREKVQSPNDIDPAALAESYESLGVPTDRLLREPASIINLARDYNSKTHSNLTGEQLARELLRLRKKGSLPRLRRG